MKVAQEFDVDNVTIIINSENKLQAVTNGENSTTLEFEDVPIVAKPDPLDSNTNLMEISPSNKRWYEFGVWLEEEFEDYSPQSSEELGLISHFAAAKTAPNKWLLFTGLKKLKGTNLYLWEGEEFTVPAKPKNKSA